MSSLFARIAAVVERDLAWRNVADVTAGSCQCPEVAWCRRGLHRQDDGGGVEHLQPVAIAYERNGTPVLRVLVSAWVPNSGKVSQPDLYLETYNAETFDFDLAESNVSFLSAEDAVTLSRMLYGYGGDDLANVLWSASLLAGAPALAGAR